MENIFNIKLWYSAYEVRLAMKRNINSTNLSEPRSPYHTKYHEIARATLKECGGKNLKAFLILKDQVGIGRAKRVMPKIGEAWHMLKCKNWKPCVWDDETWFYTSKHYDLHTLHVSEEDATQVAFTPSEEYMLRDRQTRMKPGRYHRVYAARDSDTFRSALREALEVEGYIRGSGVLDGQKLRLHRYDGNIVCPYLDGDYTNVKVYDDHLLVGSCGIDGQNSSGLIEDNRSVCDCCGDRVDEDDTTYVEWDEQRVCSDCLDREYTYAYTGRHQEWVPDSENLYRHNGGTYTSEGLEYHDLRVCEECGEVVDNDDCVELHNGDYVCAFHAEECEVTGDWYLKDDMVDTEFDGRIAGEVAVKLHPSGELGWKDRCCRLTTTGESFLWVHQDFMEGMDSDEFTAFFGVFSKALVPFSLQAEYGGFIERITKAFDPLNVRDGNAVDNAIEDVIESHIEVEDEIASPALITKETEHERIAA